MQRARASDAVALGIVDADVSQALQDGIVLNELGDSAFSHYLAKFVDGPDHGIVDGIVDNIFDKHAIDLEKIHRQVLQIGK